MSTRTPRLDWPDPIKGLAITGVVVYHIALLLYRTPPFDHPKDDWAPLAERLAQMQPLANDSTVAFALINAFRYLGWLGYQGVGVFVLLSGFGLAWSAARAPMNAGNFYRRRLWRLLPMYWAAHAVFVGMNALTGQPELSLTDSRFYLSLLTLRVTPDTWFYISPAWWYVWLMVQLYLAFPLLWRWLQRFGPKHFLAGTLLLTLFSRFVTLQLLATNAEMWSMGVLAVTRLVEFTAGMGLAYAWAQRPDPVESLLRRGWVWLVAAFVYAVGLACSFTVSGQIVAPVLLTLGGSLLVYRLVRAVRLISRLGWLGRESYPVMLLHQPLLWWFIPQALALAPSFLIFWALLAGFILVVVAGSVGLGKLVDRLAFRVVG
jgi:peptidoglycan/LPS O-acetylase OafA/YrhL